MLRCSGCSGLLRCFAWWCCELLGEIVFVSAPLPSFSTFVTELRLVPRFHKTAWWLIDAKVGDVRCFAGG